MKIIPRGCIVVIELVPMDTGVIALTDKTIRDKFSRLIVKSVGPGEELPDGMLRSIGLQVGDEVAVKKDAAIEVSGPTFDALLQNRLFLAPASAILAVLERDADDEKKMKRQQLAENISNTKGAQIIKN